MEALPPIAPTVTSSDWMRDATAAAQAVSEAVSQWDPLTFGAVVAGTVAVGLRVARNIPGWGPLIHTAGEWLISKMTPDKRAENEARQAERLTVYERGFATVVASVEALPKDATLQDLRQEISRRTRLDTPVREAIWAFIESLPKTPKE